MNQFRRWLLEQIEQLDRLYETPEPDESLWASCAGIVHEAGDRAARLGLSDLFNRSRMFGGYTGPMEAKGYLSECLAASNPAPPQSELLTVQEIAAMLNVSVRTVWRRASAGEIPTPMQIGGLTRWARRDLESWLASSSENAR